MMPISDLPVLTPAYLKIYYEELPLPLLCLLVWEENGVSSWTAAEGVGWRHLKEALCWRVCCSVLRKARSPFLVSEFYKASCYKILSAFPSNLGWKCTLQTNWLIQRAKLLCVEFHQYSYLMTLPLLQLRKYIFQNCFDHTLMTLIVFFHLYKRVFRSQLKVITVHCCRGDTVAIWHYAFFTSTFNQSQIQIDQSQFQCNQTHIQYNHIQFRINQTQSQINQSQVRFN